MTKAEESALEAYPDDRFVDYTYADMCRGFFKEGYEQAEVFLGWHSVDESLPEIDEEVIVLKDNLGTSPIYEIAMGHIVDRNHCSDYNGWNIPGVRYWMPYPKIDVEL